MKMSLAISSVVLLAALAGCETSPRGTVIDENSFSMSVPRTITMHQGDIESINVGLERGDMFKQDVRVDVATTPGIKVDPADTTIKASNAPDTTIKLTAAKDAPLGDYRLTVTGTPSAGPPATTEFHVRVVQP